MPDVAISVQDLSKRYRIGLEEERHDTLLGAMSSWVKSPLSNFKSLRKLSSFKSEVESDDIIWAVKNMSFSVDQGEVLGVIGKNGAGKSTLLKILSRITEPTSGKVEVNGRLASLLEVGTGFHPELTGKENIFLNGTILGMTKKEIEKKYDEIVDFSEINKFINTPVKRYSSGMAMRLAFAVAAYLEPEILLIDEVLAVGDTAFQQKSIGKMGDIASAGRTVLFVTHNMSALASLCSRTILLDKGQIIDDGKTDVIIQKYFSLDENNGPTGKGEIFFETDVSNGGPFILHAMRTLDERGSIRDAYSSFEPITVEIEFSLKEEIKNLVVGFELKAELKLLIFRSFHNDKEEVFKFRNNSDHRYKLQAEIPGSLLNGGNYYLEPCATVFKKYWIFKDIPGLEINISFDVPNTDHTYVNGRPGLLSPILNWQQGN